MERIGPGEESCDETYPDDGRCDNSSDDYDFGGDYGSHSHADWVADNTDADYGETEGY